MANDQTNASQSGWSRITLVVLAIVTAVGGMVVKYHEIRKSRAEADKAVHEFEAVRQKSDSGGSANGKSGSAERVLEPKARELRSLLRGTKWVAVGKVTQPTQTPQQQAETVEFTDTHLVRERGGKSRAYRYSVQPDGRLSVEGESVDVVSVSSGELTLSWGGETLRYSRPWLGRLLSWVGKWLLRLLTVLALIFLVMFIAVGVSVKLEQRNWSGAALLAVGATAVVGGSISLFGGQFLNWFIG